MDKIYLPHLDELVRLCRELPRTHMMMLARINVLVVLNMRYEKVMLDRNLTVHPYELVDGFVKDAFRELENWREASFIESPDASVDFANPKEKEEAHKDLFQMLWSMFNAREYLDRIALFEHRLDVNELSDGFLSGKRCIDFGCGHGNFAHALINKGAAFVLGIDFGERSILYSEKARDTLGVDADTICFQVATVYDAPAEDESFDFALQNGVFHHLDDEDRAYDEVHRVLKQGGWFWIYTDGSGAITHDLWDASREALEDVAPEFISAHLKYLNVGTGKRYHLGDGLKGS